MLIFSPVYNFPKVQNFYNLVGDDIIREMPYECRQNRLIFPKLEKECPYCREELFSAGKMLKESREKTHPEVSGDVVKNRAAMRMSKGGYWHGT